MVGLADEVNHWLVEGSVMPMCVPDPLDRTGLGLRLVDGFLLAYRVSGEKIEVFPGTTPIRMPLIRIGAVFTVLAIQIMAAAAAKAGPVLCSDCGRLYMPERRPRGPHFCRRCGKHAAWRAASARYRGKK